MLAEIFMLSMEAEVRSLNALTPSNSVARFVPIECRRAPPQMISRGKSTAAVWVLNRTP